MWSNEEDSMRWLYKIMKGCSRSEALQTHSKSVVNGCEQLLAAFTEKEPKDDFSNIGAK